MKKIVSVILAMAFILSLAACETANKPSGGNDTPTVKSLSVGISTDPVSWEPWGGFNVGRQELMPMVYQSLTANLPDLTNGTTVKYYVLASGYEKVGPNSYEITIREGIYDSAGNPFTAADAVFSFSTAKGLGTLSQLNAIDTLEVVDEYTFRMNTKDTLAIGDFEDLMTGFNMVTQASYEASADGMVTLPVGTAGYVLTDYVAGAHAVFNKADNGYWNAAVNESKSLADGYCPQWDVTKLDIVHFEIITDASTMVIALESGDIDIASGVSARNASLFNSGANAKKYNTMERPDNMYAMSFNVSSGSPTSSYNLRMALAHAVNSQDVLDAAFDGAGEVLNAWAYPTYIDWQDSWADDDYFAYDTDTAKEYLDAYFAETGTSAGDLHIRLLLQSGSSTNRMAEAIQAFIVTLVGNPNCVEILGYDRGAYNNAWLDPTAFDIVLLQCQTVTRIHSAYNWNLFANAVKNRHNDDVWHSGDAVAQELLNAAIDEDTSSDETVAAFQAYITEQAYIKNMLSGNYFVVAANWISGLENSVGRQNSLAILALDFDWSQSGK